MSTWKLRYAPHLGLMSPDTPTFLHTVGSADPVRQIDHIAELGFAGVEDNFLKLRTPEEQARMGKAMERHGLEMGCFANNVETWDKPVWSVPGPESRAQLERELRSTIEVAKRVNGTYVTTLSGAAPGVPRWAQLAAMTEHLKALAPIAEKAGIVMAIEPLNEWDWPGMLVQRVSEAHAIVQAVDSPAVRILFDIFHVQAMDGDLIRNLERVWSWIGVLQIADNPGRNEPGTGEVNWPHVLRWIRDRGWKGLVELEHSLSIPGQEGERAMLESLRTIDAGIG